MKRRRVDEATSIAKQQSAHREAQARESAARDSTVHKREIGLLRPRLSAAIDGALAARAAEQHRGVQLVTYQRSTIFGGFRDVEIGAYRLFDLSVPFHDTHVVRTVYLTSDGLIASGEHGKVSRESVDDICRIASRNPKSDHAWNLSLMTRLIDALGQLAR